MGEGGSPDKWATQERELADRWVATGEQAHAVVRGEGHCWWVGSGLIAVWVSLSGPAREEEKGF
jgi:hypothetical protein